MAVLFGGRTQREQRQDREFESAFKPLIAQQTAASKGAYDEAMPNLQQARTTIQDPLKYWSTILSGDHQAMSEALAPEISSTHNQYAGLRQNLAEFAPRGGGRNSALANLSMNELGDINKLIYGLRPEAANQVGDIAQFLGGLGTSELNASTGASGNALNALLSNRSQNLNAQFQRQAQLRDMMSSLGMAIGGI